MNTKSITILAMLACAGVAHAQSGNIWGTGTPQTNKPAITAPAPQQATPYISPAPQTLPAPAPVAPQAQPKPAWSLHDVPSDPAPDQAPIADSPEDLVRPPVAMDKNEAMQAVKNPESRKFLEQYSQGNSLVFPQNPPVMDEKSAAILPSPQLYVPEEPIEKYFDFDDECPTKDCPDDI